jgi:hypothetical protein
MRRGQSRIITLYNIIPLLKRYEKPSYMAIKKALCGRQPGYISVEVFFFMSLLYQESLFSCVYCSKNKVPSFTHNGCFKIAKIYLELMKSALYFLFHNFSYFLCKSYGSVIFILIETFHPLPE